MNTVGVIGAGVMGTGVAQSAAQAGFHVVLLDLTEEILQRAAEEIRNKLRFRALFTKNVELEDPDRIMERIQFVMDYQALSQADLVVENVPEKWEIKREIYPKLDAVCPAHCIFLANTSCISITRIGALTKRPAQVVGTHFMNPVPIKNTVETIRGFHTSPETIRLTEQFLQRMGKEMIIVNDFPGFVSNRISHLFMNEAAFVVQDQVADPADVDDIFKKCFGHAMGPLETADLIGLDTVVDSLDVLYESYQDPKFRCCPLLRKMVDAGLLGRKSGQGFYTY